MPQTRSRQQKLVPRASQPTYPWIPDAGDGTFRNPILHADYSDPDVIRDGRDYWMVASSFHCTPGVPVLHSKDLVNWSLVNHAVPRLPHPRYSAVQPGCGIWAPSLRKYLDQFYLFFPLPDEGIYVTTSKHPAGKWSEPWLLQAAKGWIDPCPFWDEDGSAWLAHAFANSRAGKRDRIHIRPMSTDARTLLGEGREVIHAPHHPFLEGPKVHYLNGWYYILAPGGGVTDGWQVAFRSRHIYGPYEEKIVLERGTTEINGPHQGALVESPDRREWFFIHFQDTGPFGRIVHLQPVKWRNGWPQIGIDYDHNGIGEPVRGWKKPSGAVAQAIAIPPTTDGFNSPTLGLQWQWQANHEAHWVTLKERAGWLRLQARPIASLDISLAPHFLGQKFPARGFTVETLVDFSRLNSGDMAGLGVLGGSQSGLIAIRKFKTTRDQGYEVVYLLSGRFISLGMLKERPVRLRVAVSSEGLCDFSFDFSDGEFVKAPSPMQASSAGWMGAKVGLISIASDHSQPSGYADFDYFHFSNIDPLPQPIQTNDPFG